MSLQLQHKKNDLFSSQKEENRKSIMVLSPSNDHHENAQGAHELALPDNIQTALDTLLDNYTQSGVRPDIKLCGNPLDIVSELVTQIQNITPSHMQNTSKDFMDYIINVLCDFCRQRQINHMTVHFGFSNKGIL